MTEGIEILNDGEIIIQPHEIILATTLEWVLLPSDIAGIIMGRSSISRLGLLIHVSQEYMQPGQEYFIPTEQANDFLAGYKKLLKKYNINLLNVTIRRVLKDTRALASYAQSDMYGFVVYYRVQQNSRDIQTIKVFTAELIDYLLSIKATYYLCYGGYYSQRQLVTIYPAIHKLLALKTQHDPHTLFTNVWYEKYHAIAPQS